MTLKTAWPAPAGVLASSVDARGALAALVVDTAAGVPRAGVLPPAIVLATARASMAVVLGKFNAVLVRNGLPTYIENDGNINVALPAAPGANFRYDVVYIKQNESESPFSDGNNTPTAAVVSGAPAADPSLAAVVALVPAGGLPIAAVLVPSTATTTQSTGVQITQIFPYTAAAGGTVWQRSAAERDASTWPEGSQVYLLDTKQLTTLNGTTWGGDIPFRMAAGTRTVNTASQSFTLAQAFPTGRFTQAPVVTATIATGAGEAANASVRVTGVTATGFTFVVSGLAAGGLNGLLLAWQAIQMTPTNGAG